MQQLCLQALTGNCPVCVSSSLLMRWQVGPTSRGAFCPHQQEPTQTLINWNENKALLKTDMARLSLPGTPSTAVPKTCFSGWRVQQTIKIKREKRRQEFIIFDGKSGGVCEQSSMQQISSQGKLFNTCHSNKL